MFNMALNEGDDTGNNCSGEIKLYNSSLGITLAVPDWEAVTTALILTLVIMLVLVGNILVILSIFKHKALRIAQNFFLVSLAVADLTVAVFVLPFSVIYQIVGRWKFGINLCKMWLTCDVLCCTASILHLCAIALDRYWAITDPLNYARKRTSRRVLVMIGGVWVLSIVISSPPLIGWNDWESVLRNGTVCELTIEQGYIVYSALGSFFIPLFIMSVVYVEIFIATKRRLRQRARASKLSDVKWIRHPSSPRDQDSASSDTNQNDQLHMREDIINKNENTNKSKKRKKKDNDGCLKEKNPKKPPLVIEDSITDNDEYPPLGSQCLKVLHNCDEDGPNPPSSRTTTTTLGSRTSRTASECTSPTVVRGSESVPPSTTRKYAPVNLFMQVKRRISLSKERRAARTLGIIMGVFVVCWLPFFLMYVIVPFCVSCCPSDKLKHFMAWLGYINSALNPIIYTIFNMDFRKAFKKLLHIKS
jgi:5-hydroxytryptamine receptor 1